ncbi:HAD family hydrolase [Edaphobacter albus]|uniref:HAD family hydrolase n=1 Tax=Edaphobacter sp. 4G125 TaxID=2763071 RepID=UPI0021023588|nr:HAD family phosphatase [Edaphobacter sp. 4G125]
MKNVDSLFNANGIVIWLPYNMKMTPIQAVLFDYGMVLSTSPDPAAWQRMKDISGFDEKTFHQGYWAFRHAYDRNDLNGLTYWAEVAKSGGTAFTPEQVQELMAADIDLWTRLNMPMVEWAQQLQRAGMRTGILSNIGDAMTEGLLKKFEWLGGFNHCIWSYQLNMAKPEEGIYRAAVKGLETPAGNILFLDDKAENIEAARAVGLQAIQYSDHDAFEREMEERGFATLLKP